MPDPIPGSDRLLAALQDALGGAAKPLPLIIGVDGRWGAGTSSVAAWLGWQLGVPVVALELYVAPDREGEAWRYADLARVLATATAHRRPVIVEGLCLCRALQAVDRDPDYLVWIDNTGGPEHGPEDPSDDYVRDFDPAANADFALTWHQPEPSPS